MEAEIDETERAYSKSLNEGTSRYTMNEDEYPEKERGEPDVVHQFSQQNKRAGAITDSESNHLNEYQYRSKDMQ